MKTAFRTTTTEVDLEQEINDIVNAFILGVKKDAI